MPAPSPAADPLADLTAWLAAHDAARLSLEASAPKACAELGGGEAIMDRCGGHMIRRGWWAVHLDDATWSVLAAEHQAQFRGDAAE